MMATIIQRNDELENELKIVARALELRDESSNKEQQ